MGESNEHKIPIYTFQSYLSRKKVITSAEILKTTHTVFECRIHSLTHSHTHIHTDTQESQGCKIREESVLGESFFIGVQGCTCSNPPLYPLCVCECACVYERERGRESERESTPSFSIAATKKTQRTYCAQGRKITPFSGKENRSFSLSPSIHLSQPLSLPLSHSLSSLLPFTQQLKWRSLLKRKLT